MHPHAPQKHIMPHWPITSPGSAPCTFSAGQNQPLSRVPDANPLRVIFPLNAPSPKREQLAQAASLTKPTNNRVSLSLSSLSLSLWFSAPRRQILRQGSAKNPRVPLPFSTRSVSQSAVVSFLYFPLNFSDFLPLSERRSICLLSFSAFSC